MLQPDLGNTILTLAVGFSLFILSQLPAWILMLTVSGGGLVIGASIITHLINFANSSFLNPWLDPLGQIITLFNHLRPLVLAGFWDLVWRISSQVFLFASSLFRFYFFDFV